MWLLYIFSIIPVFIGFFIWLFNKKGHIWEWIAGSAITFVITIFIHLIAVSGMTSDQEVWSGRITKATHYPEWVEKYKVAIYRTETYTTGSGKNRQTHTRRVFSHYETRYRTHHEHFEVDTDLNYSKDINEAFFNEISKNFNNLTTETPHKSGFYSGDKNVYVSYNKSGFIYPVTDIKYFENRIKAAPTVFSYPKIPEGIKVYEYPYPTDWRKSNRLINENRISENELDKLNSRLGFKKFVNVIMINFDKQDPSIAKYQEAKFIGGKKNDIVICYGGANSNKVSWAYCFGWTEKDICKRNIETIMLNNPLNNDILKKIEEEIIVNYVIKDWSKFDYITIEPKSSTYVWFFIIMFLVQIGLWWYFLNNDIDK